MKLDILIQRKRFFRVRKQQTSRIKINLKLQGLLSEFSTQRD